MQVVTPGTEKPMVVILAETGPLAGDLAACLSGRFRVERATSLQAALKSVASGCRALLILGGSQDEFGPGHADLVRQAAGADCRVLILGPGGLGLEGETGLGIVRLPSLPSPQQLFASLTGLEPGVRFGTS